MKSLQDRLILARWLHLIVGSAISILAFYLALRGISTQEVGRAFSQVKWCYLVLALIALAIHHISKTIRWKLLFSPVVNNREIKLKLNELFLALMAGQMLNLVYPGRVGDLSRIWIIGNRGAGKAGTAGTVILEKFVDTTVYALLILGLVFLTPIPNWLSGIILVVAGMLLGFWFLMVLARKDQFMTRATRRLEHLWQVDWMPLDHIRDWYKSFRIGFTGFSDLRGWQSITLLILWSVTAWGMSLCINWLIALSTGLEFRSSLETLAAQMLVLVGLQAGISVPSLPGRVGVFEYICILALGVFGIQPAVALSYGVVLHLVTMLPTLLAGWAALIILGLDRKRVLDESTTNQVS